MGQREEDETDDAGDEGGADAKEEGSSRPYLLADAIQDLEAPEDTRAAEVIAGIRRSVEAILGKRAPNTAEEAASLEIAQGFGDLVRNRTRARVDARRGKLTSGPRRIDEVPISAIVVGGKIQNARVRRDEEQYRAMRFSVAADGINSPIGIVEDELRRDKYHLVFGEGRLQAARDVGLVVVPAVIFPAGTPILELELAHFRENACRANLSRYEIAARATYLMEAHDCTVEQISKECGVPEGTLRSLVSILSRLPQPIVEAWKQGAPELTRRTLQRLAEQPDYEAALSLWADKQAAYAAAQKGESGMRKRVRAPSSRPTATTLGRLCQTLRSSARESFTRDEVVRIVEFAAGSVADVPEIFAPVPSSRRRSEPSPHSSSRELPLPSLGLPAAEGVFDLEGPDGDE